MDYQDCCQRPEKLKGEKQIRECHGDIGKHPCEPKETEQEGPEAQ